MFQRSIIVFPDDTVKSIVEAIEGANKSILIKMFLFSDPELIQAVIDAKLRGVKVKVMLNPSRRNGEEENGDARTRFEAAGIEVRDTNPSFIITHEKSMVVDAKLAFVKSLNWETKNFTETRDYAIVTSHPHEVEEIILCFEADWHRKNFDPGEEARLIWCSLNGRERIARFIDQAKHTLFVQNERYQDLVIIERLVRAASRGVKVHVMVPPPHTVKMDKIVEGVGGLRIMDDVGIKIHN
jgi:cardiolipin synthase